MTPEVVQLVAVLNAQRESALTKLAGLKEADARRSTVDSGTNLAGLLQHLTFVESKWFENIVGGGKPTRGSRSMAVDPSVSLRTLRAEYREACAASNAIIAGIGDADVPIINGGEIRNLRSVILGVIEETARHVGHADIIREQIDGTRGR
ncbi:MAG: DinB family protein [Ilumatobacteraceae bacterium]